MAKSAIYSLVLWLSWFAYGDLTPTSPLLRGSGKSPSIETLDSNRFVVKPVRSPRSQPAPSSIAKPDVDKGPARMVVEKKVEVKSGAEPNVVVTKTSTITEASAGPAPQPTESQLAPVPPNPAPISEAPLPPPSIAAQPIMEVPVVQKESAPSTAPAPDPDLTFMQKLRALILGTTDQELLELRSQPKPKREGQNVVEIDLSPTYFYFNSSSAYSVRSQSSSSPGFSGGLSLWFSPYFALQAQMQNSLGASISDQTSGALSAQTLTRNRIGVSFRNIDLNVKESVQTIWGLAYSEFDSSIAGSVSGRVRAKSSGVMLSFDAKIPSGPNYQHALGVSIEPKVSHKESSGPQGIKSGTGNLSSAISARFGGDIRFRRQNQVYWLLEHRYEKNLFKGLATYADPKTGNTPDGVSVDQGLTLFSIGYRWGK